MNLTPDFTLGPPGVNACVPDREGLMGLVRSLDNPVCVEVGSFIGWTCAGMVEAGAKHVYCVDIWMGHPDPSAEKAFMKPWLTGPEYGRVTLDKFCSNVPLLDKVTPLVGTSFHWANRLKNHRFDLVYIDANHSYEYATRDIQIWTPLVRPGGIVCGHDYCKECPGVKQAVEESGAFKMAGPSLWWRQIE